MITNIVQKDGRFKYLDVSFEDIWELDCLNFLYHELEKQFDLDKADQKERPNNFELFYTRFFEVCQKALEG